MTTKNKSQLIFATNNQHKLKEVQALLSVDMELVSLNDLGIHDDIPETGNTLEDNALQKARYIYSMTGRSCFADDTGLEVEALNNEPGVHSARYAGSQKNPKDNIDKLLHNLKKFSNKNARFRTAIALILNGEEFIFEGTVNGIIVDTESGTDGFGYDPIFIPNGHSLTFAQMPLDQKNLISHRALAVKNMEAFLIKKFGTDQPK